MGKIKLVVIEKKAKIANLLFILLEMFMSLEEIKKQFIEQVKLRAYDDKFIDKKEEKEILAIAIDKGITVESARTALLQVAEHLGYAVDSALDEYVKTKFQQAIEQNKGVTKKDYEVVFAHIDATAKGALTHPKIKEKLFGLIKENAYPVKEGMFQGGNWYTKG